MKITLEQEDIDAIVNGVTVKLKQWSFNEKKEEKIFNKKEVADYLVVPPSWVDKNFRKLPHFKMGKYVRFRKIAIDSFLEREETKLRSPRRMMLLMMTG
jgi:hypothetical protein